MSLLNSCSVISSHLTHNRSAGTVKIGSSLEVGATSHIQSICSTCYHSQLFHINFQENTDVFSQILFTLTVMAFFPPLNDFPACLRRKLIKYGRQKYQVAAIDAVAVKKHSCLIQKALQQLPKQYPRILLKRYSEKNTNFNCIIIKSVIRPLRLHSQLKYYHCISVSFQDYI